MTTSVPLSEFMPYGAPELQSGAPARLSRAIATSCLLAASCFALAGLSLQRLAPVAVEAPRTPSFEWHDLAPPPLSALPAPRLPATARPSPRAGTIPVPTPDANVPPEPTILVPPGAAFGQPGVEPGDAGPPSGIPDAAPAAPRLPAFGEHVVVDQLPEVIRRVRPDYPSLARETGVEGLVILHALVGVDGRVAELRVDAAHSIPLLDRAALDAVRDWRFAPALTNGRAVPVWVAVRVRFSLGDEAW